MLCNPANKGSFAWNRHARGRFYTIEEGSPAEVPLPTGGKRKERDIYRPREEWVLRPDVWPAVVDADTWEKAYAKLSKKKGPRSPYRADLWLSGLIYCAKCGKVMSPKRVTSGGKKTLHYHCSNWALKRIAGLDCECGYNCVKASAVEAVIVEHLRGLQADLRGSNDREAVLRLYTLRGQKEDVLTETICKGMAYYFQRLKDTFELDQKPDSKLAKLLEKAGMHPMYLQKAIRANLTDGPTDVYRWEAGGKTLLWSADDIATTVREIEETKGTVARQMLDQLQGEYDTLTRAKALAGTDRERKSLASQALRLEERMDDLEEHLTPLTKRRDDLLAEINGLTARIAEAESVFAQGENYAKAEAVRSILGEKGRILLHFRQEKSKNGSKVFNRFLPEKAEFVTCVDSDSMMEPGTTA
jgi:hypothetical protein